MKKIFLFLFLSPILIYANGNNLGSTTLSTYQIGSSAWYPIFKQASLWLFGALAIIELVLMFGLKAIKGELEIAGIFAELIRLTLLFGLFLNFYANPNWMDAIFQGFSTLGNQGNAAAGVSTVVSIDTLTDSAAELLKTINQNQSWFNPVDSVVLGLIGLIAALTILFLGIELLVAYVKFLLYLNLSVLFFAFGAFSYTRQWAYNSVTNIIKAGTEYMLIKLIIGLSIANIKTQAPIAMSSEGSLFSLLITVLMIFGLTRMIHGVAESFFTGQGVANSGSLGSIAKGAMMGAAAGATGGAAAGLSQVKAAAVESGSTSLGIGNGGMSTGKGTGKIGNFIRSSAKNTAATVGGAAMGAASGAIKGSMGFSTYSAGQKSGSGVGRAAVGMSNLANNITKSKALNKEEASDSTILGTVAPSSNSSEDSATNDSSYISGVPGSEKS